MRVYSLICLLVLCCACKRNELCYDHPHGNLRVGVSWDLLPAPLQEQLPETVCIALYPDPATTGLSTYTYYRKSLGGAITVADGTYDCLVFNADTELIQLRGMDKLETAEAYLAERTREPYASRGGSDDKHIYYAAQSQANSATREQPLIREPDRIFATSLGKVQVAIAQTQREQVIEVHPENRVLAIRLSVPVSGLDDARSCRASLSGAARSISLGRGVRGEQTGTLIFDMAKQDDGHIAQTISSFGLNRSPEGTPADACIQHILQLEFRMRDNTVAVYEFDLGGQIDFDNQGPQIEIPVSVDRPVELPQVEEPGSGFDATIDGWGPVVDIIL